MTAGTVTAGTVTAGTVTAGTVTAGTATTGTATTGAPAPADDGRVQFADFVADEVSLGLRMSWGTAADRISYACDLAGRLTVTFAAPGAGAGLIDPVHAKIICEQTDILSAADAAKADPAPAAASAGMIARELPSGEVLASCVTALHPDGTAAAHGCAPGRHPRH